MPLAKNQFPTSQDLVRIRDESKFDLLYECEVYDTDEKKGVFRLKEFFSNDRDKKEILSIALNLPNLIINAGTDFLFGEEPSIRVSLENESETKRLQDEVDRIIEENDLNTTLEQSSISLQKEGHTQFNVRMEEDRAVIEEIPFDMWLPEFSGVPFGGKPKIIRMASYINVAKEGNVPDRYIYVQQHVVGSIMHSLWTSFEKKIQEPVPFSRVPGLAAQLGFPEQESQTEIIEETEILELPCFQIDVRKTVRQRMGKSILVPIMPLIEEINDRITQISLQLLKTLDPTLQVPESAVTQDKKGRVKRKSLDVLIMAEGMPDAKYVTNDNPLIEQAFKHIEMMIEKCADLTATPRGFLMPDDKGGVETAESLKTRFMAFLKRIKRYQKTYNVAIPRMIKTALTLNGVDFPEDMEIVVEYDEGLPRDKLVDSQYYAESVTAGLMSRKTAVGALQGLEGDALDEEIKEIEADEKRAPRIAMGFSSNAPDPNANEGE